MISEYCSKKLVKLGLADDDIYQDRLKYELDVISAQNFEPIFVICHKLVKWAKMNKIKVGPGRGSAGGSLVCYLLGITTLDPIKYELQFERFLIKGRVSPPDIDLDFEKDRRDEVFDYLEELVGKERVARICTFNFMRMKSALRDVGRILNNVKLSTVNAIIKDIDEYYDSKAESISDLVKNPFMKRWVRKYPRLFEYASKLENKPRHIGVHAAGVVISSAPISENVPLQYVASKKQIITAWDMYDLEEMGFIKIDILGLKTLTIIKNAIELSDGKITTKEIDILEPNDKKILKEFALGHNEGVFQFEKKYVKEILKQVKVNSFDDLVALNALLRPGALAANAPGEYAIRKRGKPYTDINEKMKEILRKTYGLLIYQEQAMSIARKIAGFTISEADKVRKIIGKTHVGMHKLESKFIEGAIKNNFPKIEAKKIWDLIKGSGSYMFNKAHSTHYSYMAYQIMYLKYYYPTEFWTATLNMKIGKQSKAYSLIRWLLDNDIEVYPPSARDSGAYFKPVGDKKILSGLLLIKGIGEKAANQIEGLENRESLKGFVRSLDKIGRRVINKSVIEAMIKANTFNCYNVPEKELKQALKKDSQVKREKKTKISETYKESKLF